MIKIISTIVLVIGMASSAVAGPKLKHQMSLDGFQHPNLEHTLVCLPDYATASVNGVENKNMSDTILKTSILNNETSIWLYTPEYNVIKDIGKPDHTWIGVKNVNGVETIAKMNFKSMIHTITSKSDNSVGVLVSKCHFPYK